jgi:hypothetical protein
LGGGNEGFVVALGILGGGQLGAHPDL